MLSSHESPQAYESPRGSASSVACGTRTSLTWTISPYVVARSPARTASTRSGPCTASACGHRFRAAVSLVVFGVSYDTRVAALCARAPLSSRLASSVTRESRRVCPVPRAARSGLRPLSYSRVYRYTRLPLAGSVPTSVRLLYFGGVAPRRGKCQNDATTNARSRSL